ncbi:hypothetical protein BOTCAL_0082g00030 [Botryotinia calthae]|uniref:Uncharacterized protein n=1 Tax=Botryotinia calthae TaxID=38488 RepID=A0A4Y8DA64_9HELO|nr:hypothetical protein BOTCAL_0082g00030 [Botryotinia calthae]
MAYLNTGSRSRRQGVATHNHRHEIIDVKDLIRKGGEVPHPGTNDPFTLTRFLERTINVSSGALDTALGRKRTALDWLHDRSAFPDSYTFPHYYGCLQPHPPAGGHHRATEVDLTWLFSIFNAIFFMSALPSNTRVSRQNSSIFDLGNRIYLPERRDPISPTSVGSAFVANVSANFVKRVDLQFLPPMIKVSSSHLNHSGVEQPVPWEDQVGSLLGSTIDLFIQYYNCRKDRCRSDKFTHGKMHRGEAWQIIAYRFEKSTTMRSAERALGSPIKLRRKEDYERELSHWDIGELNKLENLLLHRTIETWGWAPDSQLTYVKAAQEKLNATARDEESWAMNELDLLLARHESRAMDEPIRSRSEITEPRFEGKVSPSGVGGYRLEGISEEREPRSRAAPSRSRGPEIRTETRESRYGVPTNINSTHQAATPSTATDEFKQITTYQIPQKRAMPCKHQQYTATRLSGPFVFVRLYKYDTSDLTQAIHDSLNTSGEEFKTIPQIFGFDILRLNGYFFKNNLLQDTKIVRGNDNDLGLIPKLSLPFKTASSLGTFAATTRITQDLTRKIDRTMSPRIILPSRVTIFTNSSPGDDVSALLEAMIDLYLQRYSCRKHSCLNNITSCGKAYRGQAWQNTANILEKSEMMRDMQILIDSQVRLRRYEEFVGGLSYWNKPRFLVSRDLIRELGLVAWRIEAFVYAAEKERRKRVAPGV